MRGTRRLIGPLSRIAIYLAVGAILLSAGHPRAEGHVAAFRHARRALLDHSSTPGWVYWVLALFGLAVVIEIVEVARCR